MTPRSNPLQDPAWTAGRLLDWATEDFSVRGFPDARLSAETLLAHAMKATRVQLYLRHDQPMDDETRTRFRGSVEKRRSGMPVAYILGEKEFYSLPFHVDSRVLIPRPETEILVDEVVDFLKANALVSPRICDVGTGSGAIAVVLKKQIASAIITGADVSPEALDVARVNGLRHGADVRWVESDLLEAVSEPIDLIVANLPYVPAGDLASLDASVFKFEPLRALDGGSDGLEIVRRLIDQALSSNVKALFLEIGQGQSETVTASLNGAGFDTISVRKDYSGIPRIVRAERLHGA